MKKSYIAPEMEAMEVKTSAIMEPSTPFNPNKEAEEGDGDAKMSIWEGEE